MRHPLQSKIRERKLLPSTPSEQSGAYTGELDNEFQMNKNRTLQASIKQQPSLESSRMGVFGHVCGLDNTLFSLCSDMITECLIFVSVPLWSQMALPVFSRSTSR